MTNIIRCQSKNGNLVEYVDTVIGSGTMKDVYFSPDKSYVVAFYRQALDNQSKDRIESITNRYRTNIFNQVGGDYWTDLFCWPYDIVENNGKVGIVIPTYKPCFFFKHGSVNNDMLGIKGREKEGKWFASASNQNKFLDIREKGNFLNYLKICLQITRAVRRMHAAGLCHSDLSYKNVLIDPENGHACIIDVDGLVVPGKYPPDVAGTPDFIAPEVIATSHLPKNDPTKILPSITTDRHALAILIYMYLFFRHPLRGGKINDLHDEIKDEELSMGEKALFIEHPTDSSNAVKVKQLKPASLPWADPEKMPYTIVGPYLSKLIELAFIEGLHNPAKRPTADEWENAIVKTIDLIQPCQNNKCEQQWFVFPASKKPMCPYCKTAYRGKLPVLNFYYSRKENSFSSENRRLMIWSGQSLFLWHTNRFISPNERLTEEQKKRIGYFVFHNNQWWLVNENMPDMYRLPENERVKIGEKIELTEGVQILLSKQDGGRLAVVQLVDND